MNSLKSMTSLSLLLAFSACSSRPPLALRDLGPAERDYLTSTAYYDCLSKHRYENYFKHAPIEARFELLSACMTSDSSRANRLKAHMLHTLEMSNAHPKGGAGEPSTAELFNDPVYASGLDSMTPAELQAEIERLERTLK